MAGLDTLAADPKIAFAAPVGHLHAAFMMIGAAGIPARSLKATAHPLVTALVFDRPICEIIAFPAFHAALRQVIGATFSAAFKPCGFDTCAPFKVPDLIAMPDLRVAPEPAIPKTTMQPLVFPKIANRLARITVTATLYLAHLDAAFVKFVSTLFTHSPQPGRPDIHAEIVVTGKVAVPPLATETASSAKIFIVLFNRRFSIADTALFAPIMVASGNSFYAGYTTVISARIT